MLSGHSHNTAWVWVKGCEADAPRVDSMGPCHHNTAIAPALPRGAILFGFRGIDCASGGVPEWLKGTDCKSVGFAYAGSNPAPSTRQSDQESVSGKLI